MNNTQRLHDLGQSLWLDNITRRLLDDGTLRRYIDEFSVTGLTSNPTIFDEAIGASDAYDDGIRVKAAGGKSGEALFVELALEDLRRAADMFRPIFDATGHVDGWVSMEVSPLLADDTAGSVKAAQQIYQQADRANLFVKIPGTPAGVPAIEESIFAGVPINVTLLFSRGQYLPAAEAYMRGIERRIAAGRDASGRLASLRCSSAAGTARSATRRRHELRNKLGIAVAAAHLPRAIASCWHRRAGASLPRPARSRSGCFGRSTGTKDPAAHRHAVRRGAGRARHDQHHARKDAARLRRARPAERAQWPADGGDAETVIAELRASRRRRRRVAPRSCSRRAPAPSSSRGTQLLRRIAEEATHWLAPALATHERGSGCIGGRNLPAAERAPAMAGAAARTADTSIAQAPARAVRRAIRSAASA